MQLVIRDLSKTYPNGTQALKDVSLDIPQGMFGLLGPNGAGKSTLMRIIATPQEPDEGSIRLGPSTGSGQAIDVVRQKDEVRKTLGYLPQSFGFYPKVRAEQLLDHFAVLKGIAEPGARRDVVESLLRRTNLWEVRKQRLGTFSGGMRQRFGVAVALLGNPKLIIGDGRRRKAPRTSVDPESAPTIMVVVPRVAGTFGLRTRARQTLAVARKLARGDQIAVTPGVCGRRRPRRCST